MSLTKEILPVAISVSDAKARERIAHLLRAHGGSPSFVSDLAEVLEPQWTAAILIVEDRSETDAAVARTVSLCGAMPDVLVVPFVPVGHFDERFFMSGAFEVVEDGPDLDRDIARILAAARRFLAQQQERSRLSNELAHQERLSALGLLAAGVGHEVNNPAAALLANLENVRETLEAIIAKPRYMQADALNEMVSDMLEGLSDCMQASRRIVSIVRSLNAFSRKDASAPRLVDMNDEITTVMRLIGKEVQYQANLEMQLDRDLPEVNASAHGIAQIITNLVVNALHAVEHRPRNERRLVVRTTYDDSSVMIEVADNGTGIAPENLTRIFDPFFTTKPVGQGTGLGLAITREIVQKAGGEILVESAQGEGTTFRIVFDRPAEEHAPSKTPSNMPPSQSRLRLLIVEDDDVLLRSLQRLLSQQFEVLGARSSQDALLLLADDDRIDVVLTDVVMPGASGIDFFDALQRRHPHLAQKTIFISGGVRSAEIRARIEKSGRPFVAKPIEVQELAALVRVVDSRMAA